MCEKRRIHKQISRDARDIKTFKSSPESPASLHAFGEFVGWAVRPILLPLKAGLRLLLSKSPTDCEVVRYVARVAWPSLLLIVAMMGGCSQMNRPWHEKGVSPIPVIPGQADLATFNEAVSLVESLHYEEAVGKFRQVFDNFSIAGDRKRAAESLFWIGFCREKQRRLDEARSIYLRLVKEYAGTRAAEEAYQRRLRIPDGGGNLPFGNRR